MEEAQKLISQIETVYDTLFSDYNSAYWEAQITGSEEDFKKVSSVEKEMNKYFSNKEIYETLVEYSKQEIKDELLARQIEVMRREFLKFQGDLDLLNEMSEKGSKIEQTFNTYRAEIEGNTYTDNELKDILIKSTDQELLKNVWESNKKQGELVSKKVLEMISLRNKLAESLGYKNYYELSFSAGEQSVEEVITIVDELAKNSQSTWDRVKKEIDEFLAKKQGISIEELKPWHYQNFFFQEAIPVKNIDLDKFYESDILETGKKYYESIGLKVDEIIEKSSMYEQEGKCQHAFAIDINRKGDVRTLNNLKNNATWTETLLHELGHCVYWKHMNSNIPYLIRDCAHTFTTEAIAMMMGRLPKTKSFIEFAGGRISEEELINLQESQKIAMLISMRWMMVMITFEKEMYENPHQDLNILWWEKVQKYQGVNFSRDKPDWASKIHLALYPCYYHNYLLGEILASQIHGKLSEITKQEITNCDYTNKKEIGNYLKENIFDAANKYHWNEMIKKATGEKLTTKYFEKQFLD